VGQDLVVHSLSILLGGLLRLLGRKRGEEGQGTLIFEELVGEYYSMLITLYPWTFWQVVDITGSEIMDQFLRCTTRVEILCAVVEQTERKRAFLR
jgi:hypothetical protein